MTPHPPGSCPCVGIVPEPFPIVPGTAEPNRSPFPPLGERERERFRSRQNVWKRSRNGSHVSKKEVATLGSAPQILPARALLTCGLGSLSAYRSRLQPVSGASRARGHLRPEREAAYGRMVWLFDGTALQDRFDLYRRDGFSTFRWKHPRRTMATCRAPVFLDLGSATGILAVRTWHQGPPTRGWGHLITPSVFWSWLMGTTTLPLHGLKGPC